MKKKIFAAIFIVLVLMIGIFIFGNDYQMSEKKVMIHTKTNNLSTIMTFPKHEKIKGFIVFVHGDGAQNATQDDGYKPLMERFAKQGYVSISWDKPGVGKSMGNWLYQSMTDRANEVTEVIDWVHKTYPNANYRIGLWGASQAGWVIPKVMKQENKISFALLAAPAINVMRQGIYYNVWQAKKSGTTNQEINRIKRNFINDSYLIQKYNTYQEYKMHGGSEKISADRYRFVRKLLNEDATADLSQVHGKIGLVLAAKDKNVDSVETKNVYSKVIDAKQLRIKTIPNVEHRMINPDIANSDFLINLVGVILPKYYLIDKNYLDYCETFVSQLSS